MTLDQDQPNDLMHHARAGQGQPPLVFVHGFLCRLDEWKPQLDHFAPRHTVIGCALRGHGRTPPGTVPLSVEVLSDDLVALVEGLRLQGPILVGHSLGCRIVVEAGRKMRTRPAGLVLIDGSRLGEDCGRTLNAFRSAVQRIGYRGYVADMFDGMFLDDHPAWKSSLVDHALSVPESLGLPLLESIIEWDCNELGPAIASLGTPILVIQSTVMGLEGRRALRQGEVAPFQELVLRQASRAATVSIHGCGHFCNVEAAGEVNGAIASFVAQVAPSAGTISGEVPAGPP